VVPKPRTRRKTRDSADKGRGHADDHGDTSVADDDDHRPNLVTGASGPMDIDRRSAAAVTTTAEADVAGFLDTQQIMLPFSDTPIINRNKEFRKKGGARGSGRRSSLGSRGRRASSLIENGQSALPHREVDAAEFYKHIEADGLSEPRRMRQLLVWCGERALSEKPPHGTHGSSAVLGGKKMGVVDGDESGVWLTMTTAARAIQDQLLKDFGQKSEFSDWFPREDTPKALLVLKPNPRNVDHDVKIAELEASIARFVEFTPGHSSGTSTANPVSQIKRRDQSMESTHQAPTRCATAICGWRSYQGAFARGNFARRRGS
jgi:kinetochore protein Mis13/DSN1